MDRHPSPLEIKAALLGELADDYDAHPYGSTDLTIPIRIYRLIDRAIEKAYARHNERKAA